MNIVSGTLTINLDPPYLSFHSSSHGNLESGCLTECTVEDIQKILLELGVDNSYRLPSKDFIFHSMDHYPIEMLFKFGLVPEKSSAITR